MNKHEHSYCIHNLKYCSHCNVVYCTKCDIEWTQKIIWEFNYNPYTTVTDGTADWYTTSCIYSHGES